MDEKKLQELMEDEAFMKELVQLKTKEEVQEMFKSKGVEFTMEELEEFERKGTKLLQDGTLEDVSGGHGGEGEMALFFGSILAPPVGVGAAAKYLAEGEAIPALGFLAGAAVGTGIYAALYGIGKYSVKGVKYGVKGIKHGVDKIRGKASKANADSSNK